MNVFYLIFLLSFLSAAYGQQEYFSQEVKAEGLSYFKDRIYQGCSQVKKKQDPVSKEEMKNIGERVVKTVEGYFSQAFSENPKVKKAFEKDVDILVKDAGCQNEGNHCRARAVSLALYYYQRLRPDIPVCKNYVKSAPGAPGYNMHCEVELKYRKASLEGVQGTHYGSDGVGLYKKALIEQKNNTTLELFNRILQKDRTNLHICDSVQTGAVHRFALSLDDPGDFYSGLDPDYDIRKNIPKECVDEKVSLLTQIFPTPFDQGRSTVGEDQLLPVKAKILSFIRSDPDIIVTDVVVTASASKTPFYTTIDGKKVIDPESNKRSLELAQQRRMFAEKALLDIKNLEQKFNAINFSSKAELAGPDFKPMDLNDRFVTRMTPGYIEKIEALYKKHKKIYEEKGLTVSALDLLDDKKYVNLYQAKFKPFEGFRIEIKGFKKEDMKCLELSTPSSYKAPHSSKQ